MLLHKMIEFNAIEHPTVTALRSDGVNQNYADFDRACNQLANGLASVGLKPGARVAILAKNTLAYPQLAIACMKAGFTLVPLNFRLAPAELSYILEDSKAEMLVCGDDELRGGADRSEAVKHIQHCYTLATSDDKWQDFATLYADDDTRPDFHASTDTIVSQLYTSGTTGYPKGVLIGHQQMVSGYIMTNHISPRVQVAHTGLMSLPLFHVAGLAATLFWLCSGMTVELMEDFNPVAVVEAICASEKCDTVLVPAMIQAIMAFVPNIQDYDFSPLQRITYGASPISLNILEKAIALFKCNFVQGFGMTELSCMVLALQAEDHRRALKGEEHLLRSCGRPLPGAELKVVDEGGQEVAPGTTGELLVRSPTTMAGYWQLPEKTAETVVDGWLHTGDAGYVDEEGYFYIRDRVKDMIVSGGENIYPAEVENALFSHPDIQDVAVIGIPDSKYGETPLAVCVMTADSQVSDADLIEFCRERLAGYKTPRRYEFVEEIPRNPSGKVLKRVLREPYWEGVERRVG